MTTRVFFVRPTPSQQQVLCVSKMMIFTGNANPDLARRVARQLHIPLGDLSVGKFSDGEVSVEINENVRGKDVFLIQPTCAPSNDNLMELVLMVTPSRSSASRITAVIPSGTPARMPSVCPGCHQRQGCGRHTVCRRCQPGTYG